MKEDLQEEKTREERPSRSRGARDAARDKEPSVSDAGGRTRALSTGHGTAAPQVTPGTAVLAGAPEAGPVSGERERTSGAPEGRKKTETKSAESKPVLEKREAAAPGPADQARARRTPALEAAEPEVLDGANANENSASNPPAEAGARPRTPQKADRDPGVREARDLRESREGRESKDIREREPREERLEKREAKDERLEKRDAKEEKDELLRALKMLAPGTPLRDGLESILHAKMGALIILGGSMEILELVEGGFMIDTEFTPPNVYELSKMDGAIILSQDAQRILYANTQLVPDPMLPSDETGIRHRTAQRFAIQTGALVIAISHRRVVITLYRGHMRYVLREIEMILSKANQAIQTLERYKRVLDKALVNLTALEFEELVTVFDVAKVVQRGEMVMRIVRELEGYIVELGVEGRLVTMQAEELVANVEEELLYVIQDYNASSDRSVAEVKQYLGNCSSEELLELSNFSRALGYGAAAGILDLAVFPHGYRILHKIPKLPTLIIENLVQKFARLQNIVKASIEELDAVDGIGEARARAIKSGMRRIQEQVMLDRYI